MDNKPVTSSLKDSEPTFRDIKAKAINGFLGLVIHLLLGITNMMLLILIGPTSGLSILPLLLTTPLFLVMFNSYVIVNPNEAVVVQFFGKYAATLKNEGFQFFLNPLYTKTRISLRINNFESNKLKVNDVNANPIDIAAVVVWRVFDSAEALFEVENYDHYVQIQSEAALREMATKYPYDAIEEKDIGGITLSSHQDAVAEELQISVEARLARAGIEVLEARISYLAYSTEIAQAMLRRQQAAAVVAARREIVDGAVGMVELALEQLSAKKIIELDEDKKATMVSNLLVVLCSETDTTPVVNTGSLSD
ncbi:MAG: SPFH domain-containing protein [Candidatus Thalassarchaeaceae archaeon]